MGMHPRWGLAGSAALQSTSRISPRGLRQFVDQLLDLIPLSRLGTPEALARAAGFFASDDRFYLMGVEFFVDDGNPQY
jgi:NAD(P)-dependent dehydrogenase (short-subunit alcohol dehydrogenase family)